MGNELDDEKIKMLKLEINDLFHKAESFADITIPDRAELITFLALCFNDKIQQAEERGYQRALDDVEKTLLTKIRICNSEWILVAAIRRDLNTDFAELKNSNRKAGVSRWGL